MRYRPRERDPDVRQREFDAMMRLRRQFKMTPVAGKAGTFDALCPAHDDRNKSLRVYRFPDADGNERLYFRCYAGCDFNDVRSVLGLPNFSKGGRRIYRSVRKIDSEPNRNPERIYNFEQLAALFAADGPTLRDLSLSLGVSVESLLDADAGFADGYPMFSRKRNAEVPVSAWAFPMTDPAGRACGLRMRATNADGTTAKFSWTGSTPGLFAGRRWHGAGPIAVCEGPTDRAALWDWGFDAIGKPSCNDGDEMVLALIRNLRTAKQPARPVVVFAQLDEAKPRVPGHPERGVFYPGQDGAVALADAIAWAVPWVRIITPPKGFKDYRQWAGAGGTRRAVDLLIGSKRNHRPERRTA